MHRSRRRRRSRHPRPAQPPGIPAHGGHDRCRRRDLGRPGQPGTRARGTWRRPRQAPGPARPDQHPAVHPPRPAAIDLEGTLQALRDIGYTRVEHAGFVGCTVTEFKAALDAAGLRATSGHVQIPQPFDPAAWSASLADALTLGSRYIVHPFFGIDFTTGEVVRTTAPWRAFARDLNRAGRMARDAGLKLGYHNHNWEFFRLTDNPSRTAYDVLTDATDPELVHMEMDLFWVIRARAIRSTSSARTGAGSCSSTSRT